MPKVEFIVLADGLAVTRIRMVCQLVSRLYEQSVQILINASDKQEAETLDDALWTFKDISFIPHAMLGTEVATSVPVLLTWEVKHWPELFNSVVNLAHPAPLWPENIHRVIEPVDHEPELRQQARERYQHYKQLGYQLDKLDFSSAYE